MNKIIKMYTRLLKSRPLLVQSVQTGLIMGTGDLVAQTVIEKKSLKKVELIRTAQFFALGTCLVGPILTTWYKFLSKTLGNTGKAVVLKKVAADQLFFAPNFLVVFVTALNTLQGKDLEYVKKELSGKYWDILMANYKLWPAVQVINFYVMPLHYQVLFVQTFAVVWNAYLSWKTQQEIAIKTGNYTMTKALLRIYNNLLTKHFLLVQTVQTGMIMGLGDLIAQTAAEGKSLKEIDRVRTRSFFTVGVGLVGPCSAAWYKILSRTFGDKGKAAVLKKVAVDQLLYAPFFMLVFIAAINTLEGKSWDVVKKEIDDKYFELALDNLRIWPAIQIFNFYLVPFNYQIPFVQTIGVFWNAFVSWKLNRPDKE